MKIAIIGNNDGPIRLATTLAQTEHEVVLVGLQKGAAAGAVSVPDEQSLLDLLPRYTPDLVINCFANFRYRKVHHQFPLLNVHLAPLPTYRGRHPLQWALINGEKTFGATIHAITDGIDAGPIYWRRDLKVEDGWSARELRDGLFSLVEDDFPAFINGYPGLKPRPNPLAEATYVTRRYPADSEIYDWGDRETVYRKVNALRHDEHPAFRHVAGGKLEFRRATRGEKKFVGHVGGTIVGKTGSTIEVVCTDGLTVRLICTGAEPLTLNQKI